MCCGVWDAVSWVEVSVCVAGATHNLLKKYPLTLSLGKPRLRWLRIRRSQGPLQTYYGVSGLGYYKGIIGFRV